MNLAEFKDELCADDFTGTRLDAHNISSIVRGIDRNKEFQRLFCSVLDDHPSNIQNPERIAQRFVDIANKAVDNYFEENVE